MEILILYLRNTILSAMTIESTINGVWFLTGSFLFVVITKGWCKLLVVDVPRHLNKGGL